MYSCVLVMFSTDAAASCDVAGSVFRARAIVLPLINKVGSNQFGIVFVPALAQPFQIQVVAVARQLSVYDCRLQVALAALNFNVGDDLDKLFCPKVVAHR
jgi:hypothetical protein